MISVVIPALNEEKFLADCLESLKNQDYRGGYEIIVADNGSTDSTPQIARKFGVRLVHSEKRGVGHARQAGADAARGDIIAQADADTIYPSDWLTKIASQFSAHPRAVAIAGRFLYKDPPSWAWLEYFLRHTLNRLTRLLFRRPLLISGATFAFRRQAFLDVNGYRDLSYSADQQGISSRLLKRGKIIYTPTVQVFTSSRSVNKLFAIVLRDVGIHLSRMLAYYCNGAITAWWWGVAAKTRARRIAIRTAPFSLLALLFIAYGYFIPASEVFGKVYYKADSPANVIALTFDDGPNEPYTSEILDILDRYNVKATFFIIGQNVGLSPDTVRRMVAEGHVVGNHSYSHNANHAITQYGSQDLYPAQETISKVTGVTPHLYRPPHGKKSPWELQALKKLGLIEVTWSASTGELHVKSAELLAQRIVSKSDPGEIILLHDGYGTSHDTAQADKSLTVGALPLIIERLQANGYRFVTVPDMLQVPAYNN